MPAQLEWERNGKRSALTIFKHDVVIGRDAGCQVRGDAPELANRHCRITHDGAQFFAEHLDGVTTLVNGVPISRHGLDNGDVIECGSFAVRFTESKLTKRPVPGPAPLPAPPAPPAPTAPPAAPPAPVMTAPPPDAAELSREREEVTRLRGRLDQRDEDLRKLESEVLRLRRDNELADAELAALRQELQSRDDKLAETERRVAIQNAQLDELDRRVREKDKALDAQNSQLQTLEGRARELFDANQGLRTDSARAREQARKTEAERDDIMRENTRLQNNLSKTSNLVAECQRSVQDLENERRDLQVVRDKHTQVIASQQDELVVLGEARKRVQLLYDELQNRHHHLDVSHELVKAENAKLAPENARIMAELGRLQLELQRLLRERIVDRSLQDALVELEQLRKEFNEAQRTIIRLTVDRDTFERLRLHAESHAHER